MGKIVILGSGPVGLEAALHGADAGHDVQLFERDRVAENVRAWGHVRMFSPWRLNRSELGLRQLARADRRRVEDADYPTGLEYTRDYLVPLAQSPLLRGRVHEHSAVVQIGRDRRGKLEQVDDPRERHPFRLLVSSPDGERLVRADAVLDCSGTYGNHNWMGNGGVPALGELQLQADIGYTIEDIAGAERARYAGRHVLLVGAGHSAAAALVALLDLDDTTIVWAVRSDDGRPLPVFPDDPLPERDRLARAVNALARGTSPRVDFRPSRVVERVERSGGGFEVTLAWNDATETVRVDRILALVGYRPEAEIHRELQVHACYASEGPMRLAATLGNDRGDCLSRAPQAADVLCNPEPDFFILGTKSYGRRSDFLVRTGLEQVREVYSLIGAAPRHGARSA